MTWRRLTDGGTDKQLARRLEPRWRPEFCIPSSRRTPEAVDAWVYDLAAGEMQLIAENPGIGIATDLSRNGRHVVLWRMQSRSSNDLVLRELTSGDASTCSRRTRGRAITSGGTFFHPDGKTIWLTSDHGRDRIGFGRVTLDDNGRRRVQSSSWRRGRTPTPSGSCCTRDGKTAALLWNASGRNELERVDLETLKRTPIARIARGDRRRFDVFA